MENWFRDLTGLERDDPLSVLANIVSDGDYLLSRANGRRMQAGQLTIPSLVNLRSSGGVARGEPLRLTEIVGDVTVLHRDPSNAGAVFQVASQFNLLEMVSPSISPEDGIARYAFDRTQGPACAIACGAGTLFRNYLVPLHEQVGQSTTCQIDTAEDLHAVLAGDGPALWTMKNGYLLPNPGGLDRAAMVVTSSDAALLTGLVRVGVQAKTEVTIAGTGHTVTQVYCSAVPVAYANAPVGSWEPLARLILDAAYEATFRVALAQADAGGSGRLFLTALGGGAFGNHPDWIAAAIGRAARLFADSGLEVSLVAYRAPSGLLCYGPDWPEPLSLREWRARSPDHERTVR